MASFANFTINDAKATPVAHIFSPTLKEQKDGTLVATWHERTTATTLGWWKCVLTISMPKGEPRKGTMSDADIRVFKVDFEVATPVLEVTSPTTATGIQPAPTVSYVPRSKQTFWLPERSTNGDRKDLLAMHRGGVAVGSIVEAIVHNLESVTG